MDYGVVPGQTELPPDGYCQDICNEYDHAYAVSSFEGWGWKDDESSFRETIRRDKGKCRCEAERGYRWGIQTNSQGMPYSPMNCKGYSEMFPDPNMPPPTEEENERRACGSGGVQTYVVSCPAHAQNILNTTCDLDQELGRSCCCDDGFKPTYANQNYIRKCMKQGNVQEIMGRVWLDDPKSKYPFGGVRHINVDAEYNGKTYTTYTDNGGLFSFSIPLKTGDDLDITLYLIDGHKDGKNFVNIMDEVVSINSAVSIKREFQIEQKHVDRGMEINFVFQKVGPAPIDYISDSENEDLAKLIKHYMFYQDAIDFFADVFKEEPNPLDIVVNVRNISQYCGGDAGGCYSHNAKRIFIRQSYMPFTSSGSPFSDWHEYGHAIMFKQFTPNIVQPAKNHGGFLN
ncbi:MAG: hypothetical protein KKG59_01465, partial [Nanoarchaeota archaeon]|nr:hypothetical protein [Nanoarchaeota archaeon]